MLCARIPISGFCTTAHLWVVLWKTLDCFILHGFIYLFSVSSCIQNKTKDSFLPCKALALFQQVLTKESSLNWGSCVGKKFDWANLFFILCLVLCSLTRNVLVLWNMGFQTQPHARFTSSHHNAKMSLHTTILAVLVFILIYSPFLLLGDHLPLEPPWLASGLGHSVPAPPRCLDLRNGHIGESWV